MVNKSLDETLTELEKQLAQATDEDTKTQIKAQIKAAEDEGGITEYRTIIVENQAKIQE